MDSLTNKLSGLLDAAPDPMVIVGARGDIIFANACVESSFGYAATELVGLPVETLIPERFGAVHAWHRQGYFQNPRVRPMGTALELSGRRKDGTEFPVEISLGPFESEDGPCVWSVIRDGTVHKLLAREKAFSDRLIDTVPTIILLLDAEGRIIQTNAYLQRLCGYRNDEVAGKNWFTTFLPDEDQAKIRERFEEVMRTGANAGYVNSIVTRAGARRQIEWHAQTLTDENGRVALLNVGHDVTDRIAFEEALRRAEQALRAADRRKDEFLAMLGHELRNPLAAISNALQLADVLSDADAVKRNRDIMGRQVEQLSRLVDDLVDVSRITRGALRISPHRVDLNDLVRCAVSDMQALMNEPGHSWSLTTPPDPIAIHADSARMTQVLMNLLRNAAKYTPPGGRIDVSVESTPGGVSVTVRDDGIGISHDQLESIFELFTQVSPAGHESSAGQGIGLTLARALIEMHGGTITAYSAGADQGSEFVIWLPTDAARASPAAPGAGEVNEAALLSGALEPSVTGARVLVVDDNRDAAQTLAYLLQAFGHEVATAFDGQQAVEVAEAFRPQTVLLDLGLPKRDGYQVARWIRSQPWAGGTQLVALTGWGQESDRARTREAGFDQHVTKPVSVERLQELLKAGAQGEFQQ